MGWDQNFRWAWHGTSPPPLVLVLVLCHFSWDQKGWLVLVLVLTQVFGPEVGPAQDRTVPASAPFLPLYPASPTGPQPQAWASLGEVSRCPGSGAFMWVVVFRVSMAVQRAAASKIWVRGTSCRPPRGTQLELAADLGLILTAIGAV